MYKILAKSPNVYGEFDSEGGQVVITYGVMGYSSVVPSHFGPLPYTVPKDVEDSFVGAAMCGGDKPIADKAHKWVEENPRWH